jgi:hypothetical protein
MTELRNITEIIDSSFELETLLFDIPLEQAITNLTELKSRYPNREIHLKLSDFNEHSPAFELAEVRPETQYEHAYRVEMEKAKQLDEERRDLRMLEHLQAKLQAKRNVNNSQ